MALTPSPTPSRYPLRDRHYPESLFGDFTDVDGTLTFHTRVNALVTPKTVLLDFGCGRGEVVDELNPYLRALRTYKGKCAKVIGLDVDPAGAENPYIDEFHHLKDETWPLPDVSVDVIVCDWVLEHLEAPEPFFAECHRVLVPGGVVCLRTPNKWSYFGILARWIPSRFHSRVLRRAQPLRKGEDVFPKFYRANSIGSIRRFLRRSGFSQCVYGYEGEPTYLSFSRWAYWLGALHQRWAPRCLRVNIFAFGRKLPQSPGKPPRR